MFGQLAAEQAKHAEEVSQLLQAAAALHASLADIGDLAAGGDLAAELGDLFADLSSFDVGFVGPQKVIISLSESCYSCKV